MATKPPTRCLNPHWNHHPHIIINQLGLGHTANDGFNPEKNDAEKSPLKSSTDHFQNSQAGGIPRTATQLAGLQLALAAIVPAHRHASVRQRLARKLEGSGRGEKKGREVRYDA